MVIVLLTLLGLCLGSFVNALVWRMHSQQKAKSKKQKAELSILHGRSMCTHCRHVLAWYDLLPVISWVSLMGKCRYCHKPIHWQYPLVELAMAGLFVGSYAFWPYGFDVQGLAQFVLWLVFLTGFMALIVYDLRWMLLPNRIVFPLQVLAGGQVLMLLVFTRDFATVLGALWGVVFSAGLFYVLFQVSKGKWIGGGDVKLAVVLGALVGGPANAFLLLFAASVLGSLISVPLLVAGKAKQNTRIPFGPFLIAATVIVYLFGTSLIDWYQRQILIV